MLAACDGLADRDADDWHPVTEAGDSVPAAYRRAIAVCQTCPVLTDCRDYALALLASQGQVHGVYAGLRPRELKNLARDQGRPARKVAQHGTRAMYVKGCKCRDCKYANQVEEHARRTRLRLAQSA